MNYSNVSPGVYVKEIDLSQRVRAISTSIGAIVGASDKGPIMERTLITSVRQFLDVFGKPNPKTSYMHYAALAFLEESQRLYVTRVINTNPPPASGDDRALTAGAYVTVDDMMADAPNISITNFDDGTSTPLGKYDPYNTLGFDPATPGIERVLFFVCAENPGLWNNGLYVRIRPSFASGVSFAPGTGLVDFNPTYDDPLAFYVDVFKHFVSPRQQPDESFLVRRSSNVDGFGNQEFIEDVINSRSKLIRVRNNPYSSEVKVVKSSACFFAGATGGKPVHAAHMMQGWDLYRDPEMLDVNILIQGSQPVAAGQGSTIISDICALQEHMTNVAEHRMDCIAVLDVPKTEQDVANAVSFRRNDLNLDSSYAAMYTPDVLVYDQYNDLELYVPPSGFAAASYARTDTVAETWFAPAGMNRGDLKIMGVRNIYNQGDRDALDESNLNPIRLIPGMGYKIWGANTLQSMASALSNVNVRRLLCFVEKSIAIAALYSLFEPNDRILRDLLVEICTRFLKPIEQGRGLYWFKVVCDESNNLPETIQTGDLMLDVYLDPVIPAKRIHLNAIITKTGTNFKELAAERTGTF